MKRVLVSGAMGLVGRHLLPLLAADHEVYAITRRPASNAPGVNDGVQWLHRDLASADFTAGLPSRIDAVIHLAQSQRFREGVAGMADVLAVNVAATEQLARYAAGAGASHFVLASTGGVYAAGAGVTHEESPLATPERAGWYAASKLAAEAVAFGYKQQLTPVVLRPFFVYGAGQQRVMLMPRLADNIRRGEPIALTGANGMEFTPTHASDAAMAFRQGLSLEQPATVNVCGAERLTLREVCETLGERIGLEPTFAVTDGEPANFVADGARMRALLGAPRRTFAESAGTILDA